MFILFLGGIEPFLWNLEEVFFLLIPGSAFSFYEEESTGREAAFFVNFFTSVHRP